MTLDRNDLEPYVPKLDPTPQEKMAIWEMNQRLDALLARHDVPSPASTEKQSES